MFVYAMLVKLVMLDDSKMLIEKRGWGEGVQTDTMLLPWSIKVSSSEEKKILVDGERDKCPLPPINSSD